MASKKTSKGQLKKFCQIGHYIRQKDAEFADAIDHCCMGGALRPHRGAGVTFLYPADAEFRGEITALVYSEQAEDAVALLESLIVPDCLTAAADFRREIGSKRGVRLEAEKVEAGRVTLKGGAVLVPADDFAPLRRDNIAVWTLVSGRPPLEGPEFKAAARRAPKTGGAAGAGGRGALAAAVERDFAACLRVDACRARDPYLAKAVSLLNCLKAHRPDLYTAVLPLADPSPPVTFYLLVEPYKTAGADFVLPDDALFGPAGWNGAEVFGDAAAEYAAHLTAAPSADAAQGAFVYRDRAAVVAAADAVRQQVTGPKGGALNKLTTPKKVRDAYATLVGQNAIGGLQPVLPAATLALVPGCKKLWQDEVRHVIHAHFEALRAAPGDAGVAEFAQLLDLLRTTWPGNDYAAEAQLTSLDRFKTLAVPNETFAALVRFVNSSDFLYVPPTGAATPAPPSGPYDLRVYDRGGAALAALRRSAGTVNPDGVDPAAIQAVRTYVALHGSLPPALRSGASA